jgi:hypothetical protein
MSHNNSNSHHHQHHHPGGSRGGSPTLYRLAANRQYRLLLEHLQQNHHNNTNNVNDIYWTDRYGSTCLHILCQARSSIDINLVQAVRAICRVAPQVVAWPNAATMTPLHFACEARLNVENNNIVDDVNNNSNNDTSLSSNNSKKANGQEDEQDDDDLDYSNRHLSLSTRLILHLIRANPSAVSIRTRSGFKTKTPFHIACEANADNAVLHAMLCINPRLATEPYYRNSSYYYSGGNSSSSHGGGTGDGYCSYFGGSGGASENPLQLLWKHYALHYNHYNNNNNNSNSSTTTSKMRGEMEQYYLATHAKMALLLQAAHCGSVQQPQQPTSSSSSTASTTTAPTFHLLAAACSVRCPRDYLAILLRKYPSDIARVDTATGRVPLHHAIASAHAAEHQPHTQYVIESLLQAYPQAACIAIQEPSRYCSMVQSESNDERNDNDDETTTRRRQHDQHKHKQHHDDNADVGRLPLHLAMDVGLTWHKSGIQQLTLANVNALRTMDPVTKLYPFMQSAIHANNSRLHLSTTYELLLAAPEMVHPSNTAATATAATAASCRKRNPTNNSNHATK